MTEPLTGPGPAIRVEARAELDALLRRCIQCGLCLPVCATWLATGDETMSPRGRLLLWGEVLTDPAAAGADSGWHEALDSCLGCLACTAVCPSGVPAALLATAVATAREAAPGPAPARTAALVSRLDTPARLRSLDLAARLGRAGLRLVLGADWRKRAATGGPWQALARLVDAVPRAPRSDRDLLRRLDALAGVPPTKPLNPTHRLAAEPTVAPAARARLLWFAGCANEGLLPDSSRRLRDVMTWSGAELVTAAGGGCCGALAAHAGRHERAAELREQNLAAWGAAAGAEAIITEAAGCGVEVRGYGEHLPVPQLDAIAWLAGAAHPPFGDVPLKVALHDPCHARHGQGLVAEPRRLLRAIPGLVLLDADEADACCGSGGLWSLGHAELASTLGARKAAVLAATGADLVVTANPGCLGQIARGLAGLPQPGPPILPLGDLLWYAAVRGTTMAGG